MDLTGCGWKIVLAAEANVVRAISYEARGLLRCSWQRAMYRTRQEDFPSYYEWAMCVQ